MRRTIASSLAALSLTAAPAAAEVVARGGGAVWQPVTLDVTGPESHETGEPNPFADVRLEAAFTMGDATVIVPGYFAADGDAAQTGAESGSTWRVHFVPDRPGTWRWLLSFRTGSGVALSHDPHAGEPLPGDGERGAIVVADDPAARGMLRYTGERYLRFAGSGEPFLKAGTDSPENFLAYQGFDGQRGTRTGEGTARSDEAPLAPPHRYEAHLRDWRPGDPAWRGGRGKGIIGALNYLAAAGVNSVYFLTMNVAGDGDDVWPYRARDERHRFDCSKLDQWEIVFAHMDALGIQLHAVLSETENEDLLELEEGGVFFAESRRLYYRELVARFAHHRALVWNLGEENGWDDRAKGTTGPAGRPNSHEQRKAFADEIRRLDPYRHPIVVHTLPGRYDEIYEPLLGHPSIEGPSLQVMLGPQVHRQVRRWVERSATAGRPWVVTLDEIGPHTDGVLPDAVDPEHDSVRRFALWGSLMGGGAGVEWYFGYAHPHDDLGAEDFRSRDAMWRQTRIAVDFFHRHLPFTEMLACDGLLEAGEAWCFGRPQRLYAVYLPSARRPARLRLPAGEFEVRWFDPRAGGDLQRGSPERVRGGGARALGEPPGAFDRDWVALLSAAPASLAAQRDHRVDPGGAARGEPGGQRGDREQ